MGTGFAKKKKQAKVFQEQFSKMQDQLKNAEATGQAGNGLVTLTMNGENELTKVKIKPECVDADDIEGLEDLIKAAHDDALKKLKEQMPDTDSLGSMGMPFGM